MQACVNPFCCITMRQYLFLTVVILCGSSIQIYAQQLSRYSQYTFNKLLFNPAYAGSAEALIFNVSYRNQWEGVPGAPTSSVLSGHGTLGLLNQMGIGTFIEYDNIGVHARLRAFVSYAYRFWLGNANVLAVGVQGGALYLQSNFSQVIPATNPATSDPVFMQDISAVIPNFGLGIYFQNPNFYIGLSTPQLLNNQLYNNAPNIAQLPKQYRQYYFNVGFITTLNPMLKYKPTLLFKVVGKQTLWQLDINQSLLIAEHLWIGAGMRLNASLGTESSNFMVAFAFKKGLLLAYTYDLTFTGLANYGSGSHEALMRYSFAHMQGGIYKKKHYF